MMLFTPKEIVKFKEYNATKNFDGNVVFKFISFSAGGEV
jgi:hypothetical protein